jgi:uncharacterized protein with NRDE domain
MCLIAFAFTPGQERHLLLVANRDEFHARAARPMTWWQWPHGPLAGRDEQAGGTWLALARDGRWAAVTNFRDPRAGPGSRSRGELPIQFIDSQDKPADYVRRIYLERSGFGPFNLLAGDRNSLWYCATHAAPQAVGPGVHALSNGLLDEPWPKSRRVSTSLRGLLDDGPSVDADRLFKLMDDRGHGDDHELPETGIGLDYERLLSPPFIVTPRYGTRCSTVLSLGEKNTAIERRFGVDGQRVGEVSYRFSECLGGKISQS